MSTHPWRTDWKKRYPGVGLEMQAILRLRAIGYRLVNGKSGGVWLSNRLGASWFPSWREAYSAAASRTDVLHRLEVRLFS